MPKSFGSFAHGFCNKPCLVCNMVSEVCKRHNGRLPQISSPGRGRAHARANSAAETALFAAVMAGRPRRPERVAGRSGPFGVRAEDGAALVGARDSPLARAARTPQVRPGGSRRAVIRVRSSPEGCMRTGSRFVLGVASDTRPIRTRVPAAVGQRMIRCKRAGLKSSDPPASRRSGRVTRCEWPAGRRCPLPAAGRALPRQGSPGIRVWNHTSSPAPRTAEAVPSGAGPAPASGSRAYSSRVTHTVGRASHEFPATEGCGFHCQDRKPAVSGCFFSRVTGLPR